MGKQLQYKYAPDHERGKDWREDANCLDKDPELFFPIGNTGEAAKRQIAEAKTVCRNCLAQTACLQFAIDTGQNYGIWGGATEDERRALVRQRNRMLKVADNALKQP